MRQPGRLTRAVHCLHYQTRCQLRRFKLRYMADVLQKMRRYMSRHTVDMGWGNYPVGTSPDDTRRNLQVPQDLQLIESLRLVRE